MSISGDDPKNFFNCSEKYYEVYSVSIIMLYKSSFREKSGLQVVVLEVNLEYKNEAKLRLRP